MKAAVEEGIDLGDSSQKDLRTGDRVSVPRSRPARWIVITLKAPIHAYRRYLSPLKPPSCRFYPTCSQYALEAIEVHGPVKGMWLALKRISCCHPFHRGGFDPVPPRKGANEMESKPPLS